MQTRILGWMAVTALAVLVPIHTGWAANPAPTTITIPDMYCAGCAKRVETQLGQVPGVAALRSDPEAKTTTIVPKADVALSPRALWEAVEKAGKHPSKLAGPDGTYTAKPRS